MKKLAIILIIIASILCGSAFAQHFNNVSMSGVVNGWSELVFCVDDSANFYIDDEANNYVL